MKKSLISLFIMAIVLLMSSCSDSKKVADVVVTDCQKSLAISYFHVGNLKQIDNYFSQYIFIGKGIKKDGLIQTASHADIDNMNFMQGKVISS
ncbi:MULTISPECIES: hypothetical protein [Prevotella]|uniref:Lipoprotein n=1 Tax=Prevotella herbatica TaxID=2801997 RepID=A0ABM7NUT7_9BACT|nr:MULTISPECIES: hypothetical protein [Prevotella]MDN5553186.1 hypothetical protein [Prevotella sp.]BCS84189.1 hypothetical protein prwr041_00820 [Prevotella herbatica]